MPKLLPSSAAVAGILSQLGCRSHVGACRDVPSLKPWKNCVPSAGQEVKAGDTAGTQCPAWPKDWGETKQPTPIPPSPALLLTWLSLHLVPAQAQQSRVIRSSAGSTSTGALGLMQFSTCQPSTGTASSKEVVWPSEESRELILMEITWGANYNLFVCLFVLLELIPWFNLVCGIHSCGCIMNQESSK